MRCGEWCRERTGNMRMEKKRQVWFTCTWMLAYMVAGLFVVRAALVA